MTALNVFRTSEAVHVLTDGAHFEHGAEVVLMPKVWPLPNLNAVFAARGQTSLLPLLVLAASHCSTGSFDDLKANIAPILEVCYKNALPMLAGNVDAEFVVAGWSEARGADSYIVRSHDREGPVWQVSEFGPVGLLPGVQRIVDEVFPNGFDETSFDPVRDGARIVDIQRTSFFESPHDGERPLHAHIGGFVQLTSVHRSGEISTRVIRHWRDVTRLTMPFQQQMEARLK